MLCVYINLYSLTEWELIQEHAIKTSWNMYCNNICFPHYKCVWTRFDNPQLRENYRIAININHHISYKQQILCQVHLCYCAVHAGLQWCPNPPAIEVWELPPKQPTAEQKYIRNELCKTMYYISNTYIYMYILYICIYLYIYIWHSTIIHYTVWFQKCLQTIDEPLEVEMYVLETENWNYTFHTI